MEVNEQEVYGYLFRFNYNGKTYEGISYSQATRWSPGKAATIEFLADKPISCPGKRHTQKLGRPDWCDCRNIPPGRVFSHVERCKIRITPGFPSGPGTVS